MRSLRGRVVVACAAMVVVWSCGDVPTFADGIASISAIEFPSIAVVAGDTLRDSLGRAAPLRVKAFNRDGQEVPGVSVVYLVSPPDAGIRINANGFVTATDSVRAVHLVARIGDRLQTADTSLYVVARPDQITGLGTTDSLAGGPAKGPLQVTVTGTRGSTRSPVRGVVVRYEIVAVNGGGAIDTSHVFLVDDQDRRLRNSVAAVDTTDASGVASRFILVSDTTGIRTIEIRATARPLHSETIVGNPVSFRIPLKKGK